jgi:hypothetical protein
MMLRNVALVVGAALVTAGCDLLNITGAYRGPFPAQVGLQAEEVILRRADNDRVQLILDRTRYSGDPHHVDRVIQVVTTPMTAQVLAMDLKAGDRLVVSTEFVQIGEIVDLPEIPDWPGHDYVEFPIGSHRLTAIARVSP